MPMPQLIFINVKKHSRRSSIIRIAVDVGGGGGGVRDGGDARRRGFQKSGPSVGQSAARTVRSKCACAILRNPSILQACRPSRRIPQRNSGRNNGRTRSLLRSKPKSVGCPRAQAESRGCGSRQRPLRCLRSLRVVATGAPTATRHVMGVGCVLGRPG